MAKPERDAEADQQDGAQQEEEDGLLQPGYRGHRKSHGNAEKCDPRRQQADAGEARAERKQCEEDEAGRRRREQLLDTRYQHDVHRDQNGDPVQRLGPDQPPPGLPAVDLRPLLDDADDADGERQKLPITDQRLARSVGVCDPRDRQHQRDNVGQLLPQQTAHRRTRPGGLRAVVSFEFILAHGSPICDCLLNVWSCSSPR